MKRETEKERKGQQKRRRILNAICGRAIVSRAYKEPPPIPPLLPFQEIAERFKFLSS